MSARDVLEIALKLSPSNLVKDWEFLESKDWILKVGSLKHKDKIGAIDRFNHIITLEEDFSIWLPVLDMDGETEDWADYFDLLINIFTHEVAHAMVFMDQYDECLKSLDPKKAIRKLKRELNKQTEEEEHNSIWKTWVRKYTKQQDYNFKIEANLTKEMREAYSRLERFFEI